MLLISLQFDKGTLSNVYTLKLLVLDLKCGVLIALQVIDRLKVYRN